jgi:hypothetical protein
MIETLVEWHPDQINLKSQKAGIQKYILSNISKRCPTAHHSRQGNELTFLRELLVYEASSKAIERNLPVSNINIKRNEIPLIIPPVLTEHILTAKINDPFNINNKP